MSIVPKDCKLFEPLNSLAKSRKMIFLAGLPGTGKSLLLQQLAILAHGFGRRPHLLQWDVCRLPFSTNPRVKKYYPERQGITHPGIRKAVGIWSRVAIGNWAQSHQGEKDILIGEVPIVGNRLVELIRKEVDSAESILGDCNLTFFGIPVPSQEVRRSIEKQREERSKKPLHEREKGDAQPKIMYELWKDLVDVAHRFEILKKKDVNRVIRAYDPNVYHNTFSILLKHRPTGRIDIDLRLDTKDQSVYELAVGQKDIVPTESEVKKAIKTMEDCYPKPEYLEDNVNRWYET